MVTKYNQWRRNTMGERVDSRHFDSGFENSGFVTPFKPISEPPQGGWLGFLAYLAAGVVVAVTLGYATLVVADVFIRGGA